MKHKEFYLSNISKSIKLISSIIFILLTTFDNSFAMNDDNEKSNRVTIKTTLSHQVTYDGREQESMLRGYSQRNNEDNSNCCGRCLKSLLWTDGYFFSLGVLGGTGTGLLIDLLADTSPAFLLSGLGFGSGFGGYLDRSIWLQRNFGHTWRIFNDALAEKIIELSEKPSGVCLKATAYAVSLMPYVGVIGWVGFAFLYKTSP